MNIKGFNVLEEKDKITGQNKITVLDVSDLSPLGFDIKGTFESGQCFRWKSCGDGSYNGIVRGRAVNVSLQNDRHLVINNSTSSDFENIWYNYFDLSTDYAPIIKAVDKDEFMHSCVNHSAGARMLVQDFEETLFSYILSAQNNIPRIKGLVENLCRLYGDVIYEGDCEYSGNSSNSMSSVSTNSDSIAVSNEMSGESYSRSKILGYSFPSAEKLSKDFCKIDCRVCSSANLCESPFAGYRCPYIKRTAKMIANHEIVLNFESLSAMDSEAARKELCRFSGVGEKVADCVLLYSGIRKDLCPIDTWVEKTIKERYLDENATKKDIRKFTESYFGNYAGYAQLWFFYFARNN
jgi:N-glycosylase/DNA lyase